jgi:hypothetical protein
MSVFRLPAQPHHIIVKPTSSDPQSLSRAVAESLFGLLAATHAVTRATLGLGRDPLRIGFLFILWGICCASFVSAGIASAGIDSASPIATIQGTPTVGWKGNYLVGRWARVVVPVHVDTVGTDGPLLNLSSQITAIDPDGHRVRFLSPTQSLGPGDHLLEGLIKVGRLNGDLEIRLARDDGTQEAMLTGVAGKSDWVPLPLLPATRLIVTVGKPAGFESIASSVSAGLQVKVVEIEASDLPTNGLAFDGVYSLVIAGSADLQPGQIDALQAWVAAGGRLIISLPTDQAAARKALPEWVPVRIAEQPITVREFGGLEAFSGKNLRIPQTSSLTIPKLEIDSGEVLAASRANPFLVRVPSGIGSVAVLAMDLTTSPLKDWKGLTPFCARLTGNSQNSDSIEKGVNKGINKGAQLSSTGITDLSTQIHAIQDHFDEVKRVSPWFAMIGLLGLLLIIGPLDYLIVHRLLKRPHWTWITFPLFVVGASVVASALANSSNGRSFRANQLNIVNVDVSSNSVHARHYLSLYSPQTVQTSLTMEPVSLIKDPQQKPVGRISWEGVPEATFGGMLREKGLEQGALYEQPANGELNQIPIMQWSSKSLVGDSISSAEGLVECQLRATPAGSLTGTILHRFATPIEDWMIVYQNRVYRQLKSRDDPRSIPLKQEQVWRVEQPSVFQRELRPYLTGILTMATPRFGARAASDPAHQHSSYDPLSLDPLNVIRILTFHDEVGGERYTGLTNQMLHDQDCSQLIKLGRAVLFGRIDQPLATLRQDQQVLTPDREASFVRLILPVYKSGELMNDLKRVVPD